MLFPEETSILSWGRRKKRVASLVTYFSPGGDSKVRTAHVACWNRFSVGPGHCERGVVFHAIPTAITHGVSRRVEEVFSHLLPS